MGRNVGYPVAERYVNIIETKAVDVMSAEEIRKEMEGDEALSLVKKTIKNGGDSSYRMN